jgi:RNA polymerase sigma-B factor
VTRSADLEAFSRLVELREGLERRESADARSEIEQLRENLAVTHQNLVRYLAAKFVNRGETFDDLVQVGNLGLVKAIDRFDPARGVEFTTYATPTIVGEIKRHFRDKGWAVKVPRRLQELNLAVNRAIERLTVERGHAPTVAELAEYLDATTEEVTEAQELGGAYNLISLDSEPLGESERPNQKLADYVGEIDAGLELLEDRANLEQAFKVLSGRERIVVYLRYFEHLPQSEVARRLGVSQMHVSRLQQKALEKLKTALVER